MSSAVATPGCGATLIPWGTLNGMIEATASIGVAADTVMIPAQSSCKNTARFMTNLLKNWSLRMERRIA